MTSTAVPSEVSVMIVGSGPTGLLAANLLGAYGIDCLLVERNAGTSALPRAILLDDEGFRALQAAGLADEVADHVIAGHGARYFSPDGECFASVEAPVTEHGYHRRNAFSQPALETIARSGLERFGCVTTRYSTELIRLRPHGGHVDATLRTASGRTQQLRCRFVIGCDGGHSTVREQLGIAMTGDTDSRDWVVVDTRDDPDRDRCSKFFCDPSRPMVSIPAPGGGRRYEYMVMPGEDPAAMVMPERVAKVLARFRALTPTDMVRAVVYTFHARIAERLVQGRALLLGDAAHLSPPFAGQGMNAGLRDAFNVAWKVAFAVRGALPPEVVATYETERRGPVIEMIDYALALGAIVMPTSPFNDRTRQAIKAALAGAAGDGKLALRPRPQATYDRGWLCRAAGDGHESHVGRPLPQPVVRMADGRLARLDDVLGCGFTVVGTGLACVDALARLDHPVWYSLGVRRVLVLPAGDRGTPVRAGGNTTVVSLDGEQSVWPADVGGALLLVRPDRFVAAQCNAASSGELADQASRLVRGEVDPEDEAG